MSLDSLRKYRAQIERVITMELALVTKDLAEMEQRCRVLDAEIQSDAAAYRREAEQGMAIEHVLEWHARMEARHAALQHARQAVAALTESWHHTQARLMEAGQERRILDRLGERRDQARVSEHRRREQTVTDEAANRRRVSAGERVS